MKARGWGCVTQIHNARAKVVGEFIDDTNKTRLKTGKRFSTTTKILIGFEVLTAVVMKSSGI
jgi:hypothetical protein